MMRSGNCKCRWIMCSGICTMRQWMMWSGNCELCSRMMCSGICSHLVWHLDMLETQRKCRPQPPSPHLRLKETAWAQRTGTQIRHVHCRNIWPFLFILFPCLIFQNLSSMERNILTEHSLLLFTLFVRLALAWKADFERHYIFIKHSFLGIDSPSEHVRFHRNKCWWRVSDMAPVTIGWVRMLPYRPSGCKQSPSLCVYCRISTIGVSLQL